MACANQACSCECPVFYRRKAACGSRLHRLCLRRFSRKIYQGAYYLGIPATNLATKGDSITFSTPTIEGTIYRRNKLDGQDKHPWKAEANEGDASLPTNVLTGWFDEVYEPTFNPASANLSALTLGSLTLTPAFSGSTTAYTTATTNATNTVTAAAVDSNATIAITNGSTPVTNGQAATWAEGANTLTIVVTSGALTKTYTVTVTKS